MEPKTKRPRPTAPASLAAAISMVLGDHDLLCEILVRLAFPDSLVHAAAVCRRWLRAASDPAFLRRFRDLPPPPGLLGFYLTTTSPDWNFDVHFVPARTRPPGVAAILRRARFGLDAYVAQSTRVLDCRAGRVVASLFRDGEFTYGVHTPLNPARGLDVFPRLPVTDAVDGGCWVFNEMLSKESADGGVTYIWFTLEYLFKENTATGCVYALEDDAWSMRSSASTQINYTGASSLLNTMSIFLADDKIYMGITKDSVLVLDLASSTFSRIKFHHEMALDEEVRLAPGNGSGGLYLVHADGQQLCVWLHEHIGGDGGRDWSLLHTISMRDLCSNLKMPNHVRGIYIHEVLDNANLVLLEMSGCVFCLDVKSRAFQKVYEVMTENGEGVCWIHPFMMTWPPIFPALKELTV